MKPGRRRGGGGGGGYEAVVQLRILSCAHTRTHVRKDAHAQREVGCIPTDSESSWSNQIIYLQGLNYIASVHTYCHIRHTTTGTDTPSVSHTHTHTETGRNSGHRSGDHQTNELELWTVCAFNYYNNHSFGRPRFLCQKKLHIKLKTRKVS